MRSCLCIVLLVLAGCGGEPAKKSQALALKDVPEPVMKAAQEAAKKNFPDLKFHAVTIKPSGVYELTGKTKTGKVHDVEVKPDGEVVEVE